MHCSNPTVCILKLPRLQSEYKKIETDGPLFKLFYMIPIKIWVSMLLDRKVPISIA